MIPVAPIVTIDDPRNDPREDLFAQAQTIRVRLRMTVRLQRWSGKAAQAKGGVATGTTHWSVDYIKLKRGENVITITAYDASGNAGRATKTVYLIRFR